LNFATWKLNFSNPDYGTGPEQKLFQLGFSAEPSWSNGDVAHGATILGYVSGIADESQLTDWEFCNISQEQALEFVQSINPDALIVNGRVTIQEPEA
jgi:hypothetical protein